MDIIEVCGALSNDTRLRLIEILNEEGAMSSKQAHEEFARRYNSHRRESIYKALETLVNVGLLTKYYDQEKGKIMYDTGIQRLVINLDSLEVEEDK